MAPMKLAHTIKNALASLTDALADVAEHVPAIAPSITIAPSGVTITAAPTAPIVLAPKPVACAHCGK